MVHELSLLKKEELSWTKDIDPVNEYSNKIGQEIEVVIKSIDDKKRRIDLSLRDLFDNPWDNFLANNRVGSIVETLISEIDEKKLIVKLSEEIVGISPFQEANIEKIYKLTDKFKTGDKVLAKIKSLEPKRKRVVLSIKEYYEEEQNKELEKFLFNKGETKLTLGDLLSKKKK